LKIAKYLVLSFGFVIFVGTLLLMLPACGGFDFADALFTSTSAVCVTGLIVRDTAQLPFLGQLVILVLIQLGGLGILTTSGFLLAALGGKIGVDLRLGAADELNMGSKVATRGLLMNIVGLTFVIELIGFLLLLTFGMKPWDALFHSISAFCNAGFSTFSSSLEKVRGSIVYTIAFLIVLGSIGFPVIMALFSRRKLSLHVKLTILGSFALYFVSFAIFAAYLPLKDAIFQAITPRTAGFDTIPQDDLPPFVRFITMLLMFIGGASASTAGGLKVTTLIVALLFFFSFIRGRQEVLIMGRKIPEETVKKSLAIFFVSASIIAVAIGVLVGIENFEFEEIVFEVISAFGTVGLSMGITMNLSTISKFVLTLVMFIGRVGPLTVSLFFLKRAKVLYSYPQEDVMVG